MSFVYKITLLTCDEKYLPVYYGITHNVEKRLNGTEYGHLSCVESRKTRLYRNWSKSGKDNFKIETVFTGSIEECAAKEIQLIKKERLNAKEKGLEGCLNVTDGGEHPKFSKKKKRKKDKIVRIAKPPVLCTSCFQQIRANKIVKHQKICCSNPPKFKKKKQQKRLKKLIKKFRNFEIMVKRPSQIKEKPLDWIEGKRLEKKEKLSEWRK